MWNIFFIKQNEIAGERIREMSNIISMKSAMDMQDTILLLLAASGFFSVTKSLLSFFIWAWKMFVRPPKNLQQSYGTWALITGSTDGIGKTLAFELASKGLNLVLLGRNTSKLDATCEDIKNKHGDVEIKKVVIDFDKFQVDSDGEKIEDAIRGLDVGILVNNAGVSYPYARYFHEVDVGLMERVIKVNVEGVTRVTRAVIPSMLKRKKGVIVNVGSGSSCMVPSYPLWSIYAATKAYVSMYSKCISLEYKQQGIDIQCQIPGIVATKMAKMRKSWLFVPSAEDYSRASARWIGYDQICLPYWAHALQEVMLKLVPDALLNWCLLKIFQGVRSRGLNKDSSKRSFKDQY